MEGIRILIEDNFEDGKTEEEILVKLQQRYALTRPQAKEFMCKLK